MYKLNINVRVVEGFLSSLGLALYVVIIICFMEDVFNA